MIFFVEQVLNGLQYAALLFLLSSGLTLVFGILDVINLAHGSFYLVGAYSAAFAIARTGSFAVGLVAGLFAGAVYAIVIERLVIRHLYQRGHRDQVLATFGVTLATNELVSMVAGRSPLFVPTPSILSGSLQLLGGLSYPIVRLVFIGAGTLVALGLWVLVERTRAGMLIRAAADDATTLDALGTESRNVFLMVFGLAGFLCGLAGVIVAPVMSVELGMGDNIMILTLVVIVVGGVGSIRGSLLGALLVGLVDALGRSYLPTFLGGVLRPDLAATIIPAAVSALVFILMILVLLIRPRGLAS